MNRASAPRPVSGRERVPVFDAARLIRAMSGGEPDLVVVCDSTRASPILCSLSQDPPVAREVAANDLTSGGDVLRGALFGGESLSRLERVVLLAPVGVRADRGSRLDLGELATLNLLSVLPQQCAVTTLLSTKSLMPGGAQQTFRARLEDWSVHSVVQLPLHTLISEAHATVNCVLVEVRRRDPRRIVFLTVQGSDTSTLWLNTRA